MTPPLWYPSVDRQTPLKTLYLPATSFTGLTNFVYLPPPPQKKTKKGNALGWKNAMQAKYVKEHIQNVPNQLD